MFLNEHKYKTFFAQIMHENVIDDNESKIIDKYKNQINFRKIILHHKFVPNIIDYFIFGTKNILKIIKKENIKIIHARSLFPGLIGLLVKLKYGSNIKLIYDNRGVYIDEGIMQGRWKKNGAKVRFLRFAEKLLIKKSDQVVVVSNQFKKLLVEKFGSVFVNKITVIANKTKVPTHFKVEKRSRFNNSNIFVYSGSAAKWQSIDKIFKLFCSIVKHIDNSTLKIVTYEKEPFINAMSKFPEIERNVSIVSSKFDNVINYLNKASCGILIRENNIINNVASPLKFGEYLAAGLPVLVSEGIGDTREIIEKYNVGVIVEQNDYETAIKKINNLLHKTDINQRCFEVAKKEFNQLDAFKAYKIIYDKLNYE